MLERVQKFISQSGAASRRKAEEFIRSGQVSINGKRAKLGDKVNPEKDVVTVYGKRVLPAERNIYLVLNKPKGYVVSRRDPRGRKTAFSLLPEDLRSKVWNVGRLDFQTEGLLIFTNDGDLTQELAHPSKEHEKEYEIITSVEPTDSQLEKLREGVEISSGLTNPAKVKQRGAVIHITLTEGKKRQVRRMLDAVGLDVQSLKRIRVNKYRLPADMQPGEVREISREDII